MQHSPEFLKLVTDAKRRIRETDVRTTKRALDQGERFFLVDTREESEWGNGHLPGAIHLGKGVIERDIEATVPDHDSSLVLYCGGGYRSVLAADNLGRMGYRNVISLDGGWRGWNERGLPVEDGPGADPAG